MIQKVGRYLTVDANGYLVPDVSKDLIQPHWMALIQSIIKFIEQQNDNGNIQSIYLRGNVPRGFAVDGVSDLDLIFIVKDSAVKLDRKDFEAELLMKYPFCTDIEWLISLESRFEKLPPGADYPAIVKMLKTQGLLLWGRDYLADLPPFKPGRDMVAYVPHIEKEWKEFPEFLQSHITQKQFDVECRWMGKRLLRAAFELAALGTPKFTRDLYLCYETAVEAFPVIQPLLYDLLKLTMQANAKPQEILDVFTPVAEFLIPKCREYQLKAA